MAISKTKATEPARVVINRDLSVYIPSGMVYSTDKNEINTNRLLVFIKEETNDRYIEEFGEDCEFSLSDPFAAPECFTLMEGQSLAQRFGSALDLSNEAIREAMKNFASQILAFFSGEVTAVKEAEDILVYYSKNDEPSAGFAIITPEHFYSGQIWINDSDVRHPVIEQWLSQAEKYVLTDADKVPSKPFTVPTYTEGKVSSMGALKVAVPDRLKSLDSCEKEHTTNIGNTADYNNLTNEFAFIAIPIDFEEGFHAYNSASFSINCKHASIQTAPQLALVWTQDESDRENTFTGIISSHLENTGRGGYEIHYKKLEDKLDALYVQTGESSDSVEYWCSYLAVFFHYNTIYQANIYINAQEDKAAFEAAVENWVCSARVADEEEIKAFEDKRRKKDLGDYAAEDGRIDAVKVSLLFSKDVVFNNDSDIIYDGKHHTMIGLQFNSNELDNYPQVKNHFQTFGEEIKRVVNFVEQNENLMIPKNMFHKKLQSATRKHAITGYSVFDLCAWHMITIAENGKNNYMVVLDRNLIEAIPDCYSFVAEFIKTLRAYNGKIEDFTVIIASALVVDSPVDYIEKPVLGAANPETGKVIKVSAEDSPYAGVCYRIAQLKKSEKGAKKAMSDTPQWEIKVLEDGTFGIYAYNGNDTVVTVPDQVDGFDITQISEEAFSPWKDRISKKIEENRRAIKKVILPESIKKICGNAFTGCENLSEVGFPQQLEYIGFNAFNSTALTEAVLPESVTYIGVNAFSFCHKLKNVVLPTGECTIENGVFLCCPLIDKVLFSDGGTTLLYYPENAEDKVYSIPDGVNKIASSAFSNNYLEVIILPESIETIEINAFGGSNLREIRMPARKVQIDPSSFSPDLKVTDMIYSKNKDILYFCPQCAQKESITIPDTVTDIADGAFWNCTEIKDFHIPESVRSIGICAFCSWQDEGVLNIYAPANSYTQWYIENENEEHYNFIPEGEASDPYTPEDQSNDFDISSLFGGMFGTEFRKG